MNIRTRAHMYTHTSTYKHAGQIYDALHSSNNHNNTNPPDWVLLLGEHVKVDLSELHWRQPLKLEVGPTLKELE